MERTMGPGWVGQNKLFDPPEPKHLFCGAVCVGLWGMGTTLNRSSSLQLGEVNFRLKKIKLWSQLGRFIVVQIWVPLLILWTLQG